MPIRVNEIAARLKVPSKLVLERAKELGISAAKVPSSSIDKITGEFLEQKVAEWINAQAANVPPIPAPFDAVAQSNIPLILPTSPTADIWKPIEDIPDDWEALVNPSVMEQVKAWKEQADQMRQRESYNTFLAQLRRQWSIETGVIERLYSITDGATKTLIEQGFDAALLSHEDTDKPPAEVIAVINDHQEAIEGLYDFVSGDRELGTSYIRQLHATLTAHQHTYDAIDTLGREVKPELVKGNWKALPNSLNCDAGVVFCPPIHVDSEMERLIILHREHEQNGLPPDVQAAWLHHRFTQIHPFADGNGRVARCLATLVFLKASWFPLVITRGDREPYISALRAADAGKLKPLVEFFGSLESKAIRQAFSLSEETIHGTIALRGVLDAAKEKFRQLREEQEALRKQVIATADALHVMTLKRLEEIAIEVTAVVKAEDRIFRARASWARQKDPKADYHKIQIVKCAKTLHYFANRDAYQAWVLLTVNTKTQTEVLFSFHGVGYSTGMLACAAMAYNRAQSPSGEAAIDEVIPLANEPFQFTYTENLNQVSLRFRHWLEDRILDGLNYWQKNLGV